jgi:mitochondrial protein MBA1
MAQTRMPKDIMNKMPKQQAMKSMMKKLPAGELPNDFGFLPQTIVYGPSNYPGFFSDFKTRYKIEYWRIRQSIWGMGLYVASIRRLELPLTVSRLVYMCRWQVPRHPETNRRMKKPILLRERGLVARDLHEKFYTALAQGDLAKISDLACKGLADKARIRIEQRKATRASSQKFWIEKYNGWNAPRWLPWPLTTLLPFQSTRVLAEKMVPIPIGKESWIRQCIVRLKTTQSLHKGTEEEPRTQSLTEYVVIQKLSINGEEQPWRMWGTVKPHTTFEIFDIMDGKFTPVSTFTGLVKEKIGDMTGISM